MNDINDNSFVFVLNVYRLSVKVYILLGVSVIIVFVFDEDVGLNVKVMFFIVSGNDGNVF